MIDEEGLVASVQGVTVTRLNAWVERGWIRPSVGERGMVYSQLDVARCEFVRQLRDEMEIDAETLPLILSLLDQVYGLRREMRQMLKAIETLPAEHQAAFAELLGGDNNGSDKA